MPPKTPIQKNIFGICIPYFNLHIYSSMTPYIRVFKQSGLTNETIKKNNLRAMLDMFMQDKNYK